MLAKRFNFIPYVASVHLKKINLDYAKRPRIEKRGVHTLKYIALKEIELLTDYSNSLCKGNSLSIFRAKRLIVSK